MNTVQFYLLPAVFFEVLLRLLFVKRCCCVVGKHIEITQLSEAAYSVRL